MAEQQDLGIAQVHTLDTPRHQAPVPTTARLAADWQLVKVKNTSNQTHVIFDRFYQGIELQPGQTREVPMVTDELEALIDQRRPNRGTIQKYDPTVAGKLATVERPQHPLVVEGFENPGPKPTKPATVREPELPVAQEAESKTERRKLS
jgi:hypothetical protein